MRHFNLNNLIALALWTAIAFTVYSTVAALYVLNSTNIQGLIGQ